MGAKLLKVIVVFAIFLFTIQFHAVLAYDAASLPHLPNQIIVRYKNAASTPAGLAVAAADRQQKKTSGVAGLLQYYLDTMRITAANQKTPEEILNAQRAMKVQNGVVEERSLFQMGQENTLNTQETDEFSLFKVVKTNGTQPIESVYKAYAASPGVESVLYDTIFHATVAPNDPVYPRQWDMTKMEIEKAWEITKGSDSVTVGVIDTGADYNHPDLKDHLIPGYNALIGTAGGQDDHYHGTHVSGTIGAVTNNGLAVAGINQNVRVIPIKALDSKGSGPLSVIAAGIKYAADNAASKNIKVINMSLGGPRMENGKDSCTTLLNSVIANAISKGITVVVAAGNDNAASSGYAPAGCVGPIVVGATDTADRKASFSNYGTTVTLSAPGTSILSTSTSRCPGISGGVCSLQGTSMASPHVAGVVALMYAVNSAMTPDLAKSILSSSANLDPLTSSVPLGAGRLNAYKAVLAAQSAGGGSPAPTSPPSATATPALPTFPAPTSGITPSGSISPTGTSSVPTTTPTSEPTTLPTVPPPTPTSIPRPSPFVCDPHTFPVVKRPIGCSCVNGTCSTTCSFVKNPFITPRPEDLTPTPTATPIPTDTPTPTPTPVTFRFNCPVGSSCSAPENCLGTVLPGTCPNGGVCCRSEIALRAQAEATAIKYSCVAAITIGASDFCNRPLRTVGDADGNGIVDFADYLYVVRALAGYTNRSSVNTDFVGTGNTIEYDKTVIITSLQNMCY